MSKLEDKDHTRTDRSGADEFHSLLNRTKDKDAGSFAGVVIGQLAGIRRDTPLVLYPGQPGPAAVAARSTIDLHSAHVGRELVLMFEHADPAKPIVVGVVRTGDESAHVRGSGLVEIESDGDRLVVAAKEQLVLRCGSASITLTREGRILVRGTYLSSQSSGVNRIQGGSVQLN